MYDLILKKREGGELSEAEIRFLIDAYVSGEVPDYQVSALLMAVFFRGMSHRETLALTHAMIDSGDRLDLSAIGRVVVDKHSTGGVGDKTTLVLVPLVAACGVPVMKMSGRGLGHTGGTIDKLESIPGFRSDLPLDEMVRIVSRAGACIASQTGNLTPADKKLYALRDVTATVESIPLIAASILSKKLAAGADALVFDVKCGNGALVKELADAERLAQTMTAIADMAGKKAVALITDMSQPLGEAVGNALEVREALATLHGRGPADLVELVVALGAEMLVLAGNATDAAEGARLMRSALTSGAGVEKFKEMVEAQGGDARVVDDPARLPRAPVTVDVNAPAAGYIQSIDAQGIGSLAMSLGAGRASQEDTIDLSVGVELFKKVGSRVEKGETIGRVHARTTQDADRAVHGMRHLLTLGDAPSPAAPLIKERIPAS